jgi:hypothetical protein
VVQDKDGGAESQRRQARSLAAETGISEEQALMLVRLLGSDHASLVREARNIVRQAAAKKR